MRNFRGIEKKWKTFNFLLKLTYLIIASILDHYNILLKLKNSNMKKLGFLEFLKLKND